MIERTILFCKGDRIELADLQLALGSRGSRTRHQSGDGRRPMPAPLDDEVDERAGCRAR